MVIAVVGTLDNGATFYTVEKDEPLKVTLGKSNLPPSVERGIMTMNVGEVKKIRVTPEEGYGERQKDLLQVINSPQMIEKLQPKPGMLLSLNVEKEGVTQQVPATVMEVKGTEITVDYNHPLAGHNLNYEVELLDILRQ